MADKYRSATMRSRGLTLLEILIVLTLIIAVASIAIPSMTERFESTRYDSTIDQIVATLALARAEAQRERRPVQLLWDAQSRTVYATWLDTKSLNEQEDDPLDRRDAESSQTKPQARRDGSSAGERLADAGQNATSISTGGSRLRVILPEGCRVQTAAPDVPSDAGEFPDGSILPPEPDELAAAPEQSVSLIVYMPDGSTFGQASFMVVDDAGRQSQIDVNPWTGQATVTRLESRAAEAPTEAPTDGPTGGTQSPAAPPPDASGARR